MKYDRVLLKDLMAIYERRDANSSNFKINIKIKITKEKYPKYFENRYEYDDAIQRLYEEEYIFIKKVPHDTVIDSVSLNLGKVDEIKKILDIEGVSEKRQKLLEELSKYKDKIIIDIKNGVEFRISTNKSIKQYLTDDYIDAIKAVHYMENLESDIYERNASNFLFNDSKRLGKIKGIISKIYENDMIFEEKGILQVTPFIYLKGDGIVSVNEQAIDLSKVGKPIGLPIDNIDLLSFENIQKVTTIENLTTFHNFNSRGIIIYLGGFSTRSQIKVLKKIAKICTNFYHFGDVDLGGFAILNNLMEELDLEIKGIKMDLETLKSNLRFAQKFDDNQYVTKLELLLKKPLLSPYYDVIEYLIDNNIRLEQESFYNI